MRTVGVLERMGVEYGAIDVLPMLQPLREVTTEISDWQTFPQLYVDGELLGGCDLVEEMYASGELADALGVEQPEDDLPEQGAQAPAQSPPMQIETWIARAAIAVRASQLPIARKIRPLMAEACTSARGLEALARPLKPCSSASFLHLEARAAAAGGDDVRVVDREAGALEALDVVDLRSRRRTASRPCRRRP